MSVLDRDELSGVVMLWSAESCTVDGVFVTAVGLADIIIDVIAMEGSDVADDGSFENAEVISTCRDLG